MRSRDKLRSPDEDDDRRRALLAAGTAAPFVALGLLYGEWLLAWWSLGHRPRSSIDDPKWIAGSSWMHDLTGLGLLTFIPLGVLSLALAGHFLLEPSTRRPLARPCLVLLAVWAAAGVLFFSDPWSVFYWWGD